MFDSVWTLAAVLVFAFAAVNVAVFALLDEVAPEGTGAEALKWLTTAGAGGMALGAALAGALAGSGSLAGALALPARRHFVAAVVASRGAGRSEIPPRPRVGPERDLGAGG